MMRVSFFFYLDPPLESQCCKLFKSYLKRKRKNLQYMWISVEKAFEINACGYA